ncbi:MAG: hypothetical protein WCK78_02925 [Paludibacter sp.]
MIEIKYKIGIFIFLLFSVLTAYLYFGEMIFNTAEYPMWKSKFDYIEKNHTSKNIIIGDSRAIAGFVPKLLSKNYYNFALGGGTPIESYYILKKYLEKQKLDTVIISFSPVHLERSIVFFERTLKFNFISTKYISEVLAVSKELNDNFPDSLNGYKGFEFSSDYLLFKSKTYLIKYKFPTYYINDFRGSLYKPMYFTNKIVYNEINDRCGNYDFGRKDSATGLNYEALEKRTFRNSRVMDYYLKKILKLITENNIKAYYIVAPFNRGSYEQLDTCYVKKYNSYFEGLKYQYKNVVWKNNIFFYENNCFGDPSHLNYRGQLKFSNYVKMEVLNNAL